MLWKIISFLQDNHISIYLSCTTPVPVGYKSLYPISPSQTVEKFQRRLSFKDSQGSFTFL